jgi:peptide chain release factor 1
MNRLPDILPFRKRLEQIDAMMSRPDFYDDPRRATSMTKEHQKLGQLVERYDALRKTEQQVRDNQALIQDTAQDEELRAMAREEQPELEARCEELEREVLTGMIPPDESDSRNTILEIRAGAGGDEASLFVADLHRMYTRYAEERGWSIEPLSASPSECGGLKEVCFLVRGDEVYKTLKFESGVHRVQRVPQTETQGRIHTSTVTVAVLPEAEEVDIHIDPAELEITVARASGPGGQGVNTTDSAVQIIHKPTGMIVKCADERSQLKNKLKAMTVLRARLLEKKQDEEQAKYAANRRSQVGSGDRSERIRTYNFPQSRLTDHRIGLTLHDLPQIMEGDLGPVVQALQDADNAAKLDALARPG